MNVPMAHPKHPVPPAGASTIPAPTPCPACGACPTCGRSATPSWPAVPFAQPWWGIVPPMPAPVYDVSGNIIGTKDLSTPTLKINRES